MTPVGVVSSDLETLVHERTGRRIQNLRVFRQGDSVVLKGSTRSFYGKQLAQHAVLSQLGSTLVLNDITVLSAGSR